ncbi:MAG: hypothetical protein U0514_02095 [Candidatus Andersenbacteria bacterium]
MLVAEEVGQRLLVGAREGNERAPDVARRQHAELFTQNPGRTPVVGH